MGAAITKALDMVEERNVSIVQMVFRIIARGFS